MMVRRVLVCIAMLIVAMSTSVVALAAPIIDTKCEEGTKTCEANGEQRTPAPSTEPPQPTEDSGTTPSVPPPPRFIDFWEPVKGEVNGCTEVPGGDRPCGAQRGTCEFNGYQVRQLETDVFANVQIGNQVETPDGGENFEGTRRDTEEGSDSSLGYACMEPGEGATSAGGEPVVIAVTQSDFAKLPVSPPQAHAGPDAGWIPVNMVVVLHASGEDQVLETTILDTPVSVRAVPIEYSWDLGDGNTITTTKPGQPYPSTEVASEYRYEGWYDVTLTTTFAGQFSVDGGEWQDIDGTITVESEPVEIFSKSLESRLVNGDVPVDEEEDPWIPPRTDETEGSPDPNAQNRTI